MQTNHVILVTSSFSKNSVFKMFSVHTEKKAAVFKFLRFKERFRKAPFFKWISVDGRHNLSDKAAFSNFSSLMCSGPYGWFRWLRFA